MIRDLQKSHSEARYTHNDEKDIERSFSSQNIHQDIVHLMIEQSAPSNILRMPTVEEELFEELLNINKKPICICGRALRPIKKRFVGLYCHSYGDDNVYPSCSECNLSFGPDPHHMNIHYNNNTNLHNDIIWLCPSKQLYPHLFGFFLCKTCCVEQMLSNQWTKQFSSTNKILNFILNELEKLEQDEMDEMEEINNRIPLEIHTPSTPSKDIEIDSNIDRKKHGRKHSKVLSKMRSQSKIDLNLIYRGDKDILTIDGKEKYIAIKLMNERQKELANIFAKLYDLNQWLTLLEYVCSDIVDFEFGYKFKTNTATNTVTKDVDDDGMSYFEHIFKMTAWTEIRNKLHSTRIEWNLEGIFWRNCLQKFLNKFCYCLGKKGVCCKPNDDEFECCWAKIQFCFMGSIRLGYLSIIFRYIYITLIILIIYYWYTNNQYHIFYLYFYYIFIGFAGFELFIINYMHHFVTMFKLKTILKWGYKTVPKSILTGLIIDDIVWYNSPPLIILNDQRNNILNETIGILRHLLMLNSFKLIVMIVSGLLQINAEPNTSYNVILSSILTVSIIIYYGFLHYFTNKYYFKNKDGTIIKKWPYKSYKTLYLGLCSLLLLCLRNVLNPFIDDLISILVLILYPFMLFLTTTLAVSSSCLWIMLSFSCHYSFMSQSIEANKCIFWIIALIIGFFLCELETRRISRSLRWSDMKRNDNWVRGGCITNCPLHFCCAGCTAD